MLFSRGRYSINVTNSWGESVEKYISELYHLAENCKYGAMKDELTRDSLVVEILD